MNVRDDYASLLRSMLSPSWQKPSDRKIEVLLKKLDDTKNDDAVAGHAVETSKVIEIALCEQNILVLRPDVLYRLTQREGCAECSRIAKTYTEVP